MIFGHDHVYDYDYHYGNDYVKILPIMNDYQYPSKSEYGDIRCDTG